MTRRLARSGLAILAAVLVPGASAAQAGVAVLLQADSLAAQGRPWHAARHLVAAAAREPFPDAELVVAVARAELRARHPEQAQSLLIGQPWLAEYRAGEALELLAEAELQRGMPLRAVEHFLRGMPLAARDARGSESWATARLAVRIAVAFEAAGLPDSAAAYYARARELGLRSIHTWLELREARVCRDTLRARQLLDDLPPELAGQAARARIAAYQLAGDTPRALYIALESNVYLSAGRLALALFDSATARAQLYRLLDRAPLSDDGAQALELALHTVPPTNAAERVTLGRALKSRRREPEGLTQLTRAVQSGDSSGGTLVLLGELLAGAGRLTEAERAYRAAAEDSSVAALAIYRRARVLVRRGDPGAVSALSGFATRFPSDTAAPTALYLAADLAAEGAAPGGGPPEVRYADLIARFPLDLRSSQARFRLAARYLLGGRYDSAAYWWASEVAANGPQARGARYWLGRVARTQADTARADSLWRGLAREDSIGYYGALARRGTGLSLPRVPPAPPPPPSERVVAVLARIDTLVLVRLDSEARAEVQHVLVRPPEDPDAVLALSAGLAERGFGGAAVRLAWSAAAKLSLSDPRVVRAVFPWPMRRLVELEAEENAVDPYLFAALIRQESTFDTEALSPAGARGLAQLVPGTATLTARGLDVTFRADWITVPDLNLHLGAAHLAELVQRFGGRVEAALAAYNAGAAPVRRWLTLPGAADPELFVELIGYPETRNYVRSVLRNRDMYRALYPEAQR